MNANLLRAEWRAVRRASLRLMHNSLSLVGLMAVGVAGVVATHPEYAHAVGRWFVPATQPQFSMELLQPIPQPSLPDPMVGAIVHPSGEASRLLGLAEAQRPTAEADPAVTMNKVSVTLRSAMSHEQREVTGYLSKKYRINSDAIAMLVDAAYLTGKDLSLDPLLLLSVMGVESGFNPFAESTAGASGLMQLMAKVHRDKLNNFGGPNIALNPVVNLRVGAMVLKDCIRRGGSLADGLRLYVGAGTGDDSGYGSRVLQEKDRLAQAVRGNARPRTDPATSVDAKIARPARGVEADKADLKADGKPDARHGETDPDHGRFGHDSVATL